ncbi:MAG: ParB/RepB/Spo0J family partition protein [Paracoccaceae bacterium]
MTDYPVTEHDPWAYDDDPAQILREARAKGLLLETITLDAIDANYLSRDRIGQDEEELEALIASIRMRGQQTPVDVVALVNPEDGLTHGLVSGLRRLTALRRLFAETGDPKFGSVRALINRPETVQEAYMAMVEENEIRVNLSYYERAHVAVKAMNNKIYVDQRSALRGLFANTTRAKRSKIGTFITLVETFGGALYFPSAISEKLGLALARELIRDPGFADYALEQLRNTPRESAAAEVRLLADILRARQMETAAQHCPAASVQAETPARPRIRSTEQPAKGERIHSNAGRGLRLSYTPDQNRVEITGDGVTERFIEDLQDWLKKR